jgi:two-component system chemotaxis family response regulator WspR
MRADRQAPLSDTHGTVLLVEDEKSTFALVRRCLRSEGLEVRWCERAEGALAAARECAPALILMDLNLRRVHGLELLERLKADPELAPIPVIMLSSEEDPEVKRQAFERGAIDYIVKMPPAVELRARVQVHIRSYRAQRERDAALAALHRALFKLERRNERLSTMTTTDPLTGVRNRRAFQEQLARAGRRCAAQGAPLSLMLIDIDHFKQYNDTLGHPAGDAALRRVASVLDDAALGQGSRAARYGGEEFAVLLPGLDEARAAALAEAVRRGVRSLSILHPSPAASGVLTVSIGVAEAIDPRARGELVSRADFALYAAKGAGRDCVQRFGRLQPQDSRQAE